MDSSLEQARFLCPGCEYGHFFSVVKDVNGIPYDTYYTCGAMEGPQGPGGWDGKTCPNFVEKAEKQEPEWEITTTKGGVVECDCGELFVLCDKR
jgi:hypothetical protein